MDKANRDLIVSVAVVAVIIVGGYFALTVYTGMSSPFSVVMSQSMQHSETESQIGTIDTGDIVIVMDPSKAEIQSYVEGTQTGYRTFGDYGSVIIYERGNSQNPVIHRAIVWLDYNAATDTWSASSLRDYSGTWYFMDENGQRQQTWNNIRGTLYFADITQSNKTVSINVDNLPKTSGYLTMGDNPMDNRYFDQSTQIISHLISMDDIRSVPVLEIPWLGTLKILINNDGRNLEYVTNSLPSLIMTMVTIFGLLIAVDGVALYRNEKGIRYKLTRSRECRR